MTVTKNFEEFVGYMYDMNYNEIYDFYQAAVGNVDGQSTFNVDKANGSDDILIIYNANYALRLTPDAAAYLPKWIEENLMEGLDAESYWGMKHAMEKD